MKTIVAQAEALNGDVFQVVRIDAGVCEYDLSGRLWVKDLYRLEKIYQGNGLAIPLDRVENTTYLTATQDGAFECLRAALEYVARVYGGPKEDKILCG